MIVAAHPIAAQALAVHTAPPPVRRGTPLNLQKLKLPHLADDEREFSTWLSERLAAEPGAAEHAELFADAHASVLRWRRRYKGNPRLWRSLMKADRVVKEIVEAAPVLAAAREVVAAAPPGERFTIVDLCSGKGFLSMVLSELLPSERVERCVLVDKAWPPFDWVGPIAEHHISDEHIYGARGESTLSPSSSSSAESTYYNTWPIPLVTSKQNLKNKATLRGLSRRLFDKCEGPVLLLAVHLCGTLSLRAVDLFNDHENVKMLALKPCCLPGMVHAKRDEIFQIGNHSFDSSEVCASGRFKSGGVWDGPPRADLVPRFERWSGHLLAGMEPSSTGRKGSHFSRVQVKGGYQNTFLFAERGPQLTEALWRRLDAAESRPHAIRPTVRPRAPPPRAMVATTVPESSDLDLEALWRLPERHPVLVSFLQIFQGHFDNHPQVAANEAAGLTPREGGGHEHIHCAIRPLPGIGTSGKVHVLATYYFNGNPMAVFRERLYAIDYVDNDPQFGACIRMSIYIPRDHLGVRLREAADAGLLINELANDYVGFPEGAELEVMKVPDADVFWVKRGGEDGELPRFEGRMRTESITLVSEMSGADIIVKDDISLWADGIAVNDRGQVAATGEMIYGNINGVPYKYSRVDGKHWTATGKKREAA